MQTVATGAGRKNDSTANNAQNQRIIQLSFEKFCPANVEYNNYIQRFETELEIYNLLTEQAVRRNLILLF